MVMVTKMVRNCSDTTGSKQKNVQQGIRCQLSTQSCFQCFAPSSEWHQHLQTLVTLLRRHQKHRKARHQSHLLILSRGPHLQFRCQLHVQHMRHLFWSTSSQRVYLESRRHLYLLQRLLFVVTYVSYAGGLVEGSEDSQLLKACLTNCMPSLTILYAKLVLSEHSTRRQLLVDYAGRLTETLDEGGSAPSKTGRPRIITSHHHP